jgi:hypothetical protein
MNCPVCSGPAHDITSNTFDGRSFYCVHCRVFDISGTVWGSGMLQMLTPEQRREALKKAKLYAPNGQRPIILSYFL